MASRIKDAPPPREFACRALFCAFFRVPWDAESRRTKRVFWRKALRKHALWVAWRGPTGSTPRTYHMVWYVPGSDPALASGGDELADLGGGTARTQPRHSFRSSERANRAPSQEFALVEDDSSTITDPRFAALTRGYSRYALFEGTHVFRAWKSCTILWPPSPKGEGSSPPRPQPNPDAPVCTSFCRSFAAVWPQFGSFLSRFWNGCVKPAHFSRILDV